MTPDRQVIDEARKTLDTSERHANGDRDIPAPTARELRLAIRSLLALIDRYNTPSKRLAAQHDEQFHNLLRGTRSHIQQLRATVRDLDDFATVLDEFLKPAGGGR